MKIEIEIDNENKHIKKLIIPEEINPINAMSILIECQRFIVGKLEYKENKNKIIQPKSKILGGLN